MTEDGGPLRPGQIPADVRASLRAGGGETAEAYSEALRLMLAFHRGDRPRTAPPMVLQALCDIAFAEMAARRREGCGMGHAEAVRQVQRDAGAWMLALRLPDVADAAEAIVAGEAAA